jgi:hypothetical protein
LCRDLYQHRCLAAFRERLLHFGLLSGACWVCALPAPTINHNRENVNPEQWVAGCAVNVVAIAPRYAPLCPGCCSYCSASCKNACDRTMRPLSCNIVTLLPLLALSA